MKIPENIPKAQKTTNSKKNNHHTNPKNKQTNKQKNSQPQAKPMRTKQKSGALFWRSQNNKNIKLKPYSNPEGICSGILYPVEMLHLQRTICISARIFLLE